MPRGISVALPHPADVHLGFVPLLDAAPLILAVELGFFADEGLQVALHRQIGWGNVRDKLVYGQLHASHALVGMPPASVLGRDRFAEPVVAVMSLGTGGNAIALNRQLTDAGVTNVTELATWLSRRPKGATPPAFAHVFSCSTHHYLLRAWLASGGIDPDRDVRLSVMPPPQMAGQLLAGTLDGFCVGEPWGTIAEDRNAGRIVAATSELLPEHPEKVLAVNRHWVARSPQIAVALVRAILRACSFCHDPANAGRIAEVLSRPGYLDVSAERLARAFARQRGTTRVASSHDPAKTFPGATHAAWVLHEMIRWDHLPAEPGPDVLAAAGASVNTDIYRRAAETLGIACPDNDFAPMRVPGGWFDPKQSQSSLQEQFQGSGPLRRPGRARSSDGVPQGSLL